MKKKKIIIILLVLFPIIFMAGMFLEGWIDVAMSIGKPSIEIIPLRSKEGADTLYLISKHWGITGDHSEVALSKNYPSYNHERWEPDSTKDIIWLSATLFFKNTPELLTIWMNVPPKFNPSFVSNHPFKLIEVENPKVYKLYEMVDSSLKVLQ